MIILLGILGTNELTLLVALFFVIFLPIFFYWIGKRSGYRQGQLDIYKEREKRGKD